MPEDTRHPSVRFEPLRPASRRQVVAGVLLGPLLWLVALVLAAWLFEYSWAIAVGLSLTFAAFVVSLVVLVLLHRARARQEQRYAELR